MSRIGRTAFLAAALLVGTGGAAAAERNLLAGSTVDFLVSGNPGDSYDIAARLFARYLEAALGDGTEVVVRNNTEGGGRLTMQQLFAGEPDGHLIAMVHSGLLADQLIEGGDAAFDFVGASWIGKLSDASRLLVAGPAAPYSDLAGLRAADGPQTISGISATSFSTIEIWLMNAMLGTHMQPILGYDGSSKFLSLLRGEVLLTNGSATSMQAVLESPGVHLLLFTSRGLGADRFGLAPALADVAPAEHRPLVDFIDANAQLGRLLLAPPGLPPEIAAAWQDAFARVTADPDFLAEGEALGLEIAPLGGPEVTAIIQALFADSAGLHETLQRAITCGQSRAEGREDGC
ncbi:MAG TPA: tripartite tricarboxylate transporter substrate-binding protein [Kiloniellales bacterium]|nr:tripartite tricarboxylate transporter substrate-binding protein [Kiloniellales bacterium]